MSPESLETWEWNKRAVTGTAEYVTVNSFLHMNYKHYVCKCIPFQRKKKKSVLMREKFCFYEIIIVLAFCFYGIPFKSC